MDDDTTGPPPNDRFDVIVIGGGAAGLSGALTLARARRRVLVLDAGEPRNAAAAAVHGFFTRDGDSPVDLLAIGRREVERYGGEVRRATVTGARADGDGDGFVVALNGGGELAARRLLVTTGLVDELPAIPGVAEQWGRGVLHCPYCHGWEVRDQTIVVIGTAAMAGHHALLWSQWSDDVTLVLHGPVELPADEAARLDRRGVRVLAGHVDEVVSVEGAVSGVIVDGELIEARAVIVGGFLAARSAVFDGLGLVPADQRFGDHVIGTHIPCDAMGETEVPGVYVAGNVTNLAAQVGAAAAGGATAAAMINVDLLLADTAPTEPHPSF